MNHINHIRSYFHAMAGIHRPSCRLPVAGLFTVYVQIDIRQKDSAIWVKQSNTHSWNRGALESGAMLHFVWQIWIHGWEKRLWGAQTDRFFGKEVKRCSVSARLYNCMELLQIEHGMQRTYPVLFSIPVGIKRYYICSLCSSFLLSALDLIRIWFLNVFFHSCTGSIPFKAFAW